MFCSLSQAIGDKKAKQDNICIRTPQKKFFQYFNIYILEMHPKVFILVWEADLQQLMLFQCCTSFVFRSVM